MKLCFLTSVDHPSAFKRRRLGIKSKTTPKSRTARIKQNTFNMWPTGFPTSYRAGHSRARGKWRKNIRNFFLHDAISNLTFFFLKTETVMGRVRVLLNQEIILLNPPWYSWFWHERYYDDLSFGFDVRWPLKGQLKMVNDLTTRLPSVSERAICMWPAQREDNYLSKNKGVGVRSLSVPDLDIF